MSADMKDCRAIRIGLSTHGAYGKGGSEMLYVIKLLFLRGREGLKQAVGIRQRGATYLTAKLPAICRITEQGGAFFIKYRSLSFLVKKTGRVVIPAASSFFFISFNSSR